jgi:hypothetical protein
LIVLTIPLTIINWPYCVCCCGCIVCVWFSTWYVIGSMHVYFFYLNLIYQRSYGKHIFANLSLSVSEWLLLAPNKQFVSYIMAWTSYTLYVRKTYWIREVIILSPRCVIFPTLWTPMCMPLTRQGTYLRPRGYPNWRHSTSGETRYIFQPWILTGFNHSKSKISESYQTFVSMKLYVNMPTWQE